MVQQRLAIMYHVAVQGRIRAKQLIQVQPVYVDQSGDGQKQLGSGGSTCSCKIAFYLTFCAS